MSAISSALAEKLGMSDNDYSFPPDLARLSGSYQSLNDTEIDNLLTDDTDLNDHRHAASINRSEKENVPGVNDQTFHINSIRDSIASLRPFLVKKLKEEAQVIQVQELFPSGESGYRKTITLVALLDLIHEQVVAIDSHVAAISESTSNQDIRDSNKSKKEYISSTNSIFDDEIANLSRAKLHPYSRRFGAREIRLHDLRRLEDQFSIYEEPTILVRRHAVLISANPLRVIVMADKMILIVPDGADSLLYLLHDHLHEMVDSPGFRDFITNEFQSYQAIFSTITALHSQECSQIGQAVEETKREFKASTSITIKLQERIHTLKAQVARKLVRVNSFRRLFQEIIQQSDNISYMNLTALKENPQLYSELSSSPEILNLGGEIENLMDSYLMDYNTMSSKLQFLASEVDTMDELVHFKLDNSRNEFLIIDASMNIVMASVTMSTFFASVFGMNLVNGIENISPAIFWCLFAGQCLFIFILCFGIYRYYGITKLLPTRVAHKRVKLW